MHALLLVWWGFSKTCFLPFFPHTATLASICSVAAEEAS
jgi:hypothetical protein